MHLSQGHAPCPNLFPFQNAKETLLARTTKEVENEGKGRRAFQAKNVQDGLAIQELCNCASPILEDDKDTANFRACNYYGSDLEPRFLEI